MKKWDILSLFVSASWILGLCIILLSNTLPFVKADQTISISGAVPPQASDFQLSVTNDKSSTVSQNTILTYTITYGSHLFYSDNVTLEAYWDLGTISGDTSPSIDGMDYVGGSAGTAYRNTNPIVNLSSQKISWSISSLPAQATNNTVRFQLKTNSSYTGTSTVNFPVRVRLIATNYTTSYQSINIPYQYDQSQITPTPEPTPTPTPTPGSSESKTTNTSPAPTSNIPTSNPSPSSPLPIATEQSLSNPQSNAPVQSITIVNISDSNIQVGLTLNKVASATIFYGITPTALSSESPVGINGTDGSINLDNLAANTTYYLQILNKNPNGVTTRSEVFAIQTAQTSAQPQVANASLVIASDNEILYSAALNNTSDNPSGRLRQTPLIPISQGTNYTFAFKLTKLNKIKNVSMLLTNTSILGVSNFHPISQPLTYSFPIIEGDNGTFGVEIKNPTVPGMYDVSIRVSDYDGNITTQKIAEIRVLKPFRVYTLSKDPIEDARIVIYHLNTETKKYELLPNFGGTSNPIYTNANGEASESLPKGVYKADFGRIGYIGKDNVVFSIGITPTDDFPTVYLKPSIITPVSLFIYYRNALSDYIGTTNEYIAAIQQSYRYFDLIGLGIIFCFVSITLLLFKIRSHIHFVHMPLYFHHHMLTFFHQESGYIRGAVINRQSKLPIPQATVFLIEEQTNHVLHQTTTTTKGSFLFPQKDGHHKVSIFKEGYEPSGQIGYTPGIVVALEPGSVDTLTLWRIILKSLEDGLSLFFEFFLFFSFLFEIAFLPALGLIKTLPWLMMSIFNIILWIFFLREKGKQLS